MVDIVIWNTLANQNGAPHRLNKKRAEYKRKATTQLQSPGHFKHSKQKTSGHPNQNENNHLTNCTRQKQQTNLRNKQNIVNSLSAREIAENTLRRQNKKNHKGFTYLTMHKPNLHQTFRQTEPPEDVSPKSPGEESPTGKIFHQIHAGIEGRKQRRLNREQPNPRQQARHLQRQIRLL